MKILFYIVMVIAYMLVTFFGLGPVLLADGAMGERMMTLFIVILLYLFLAWITMRVKRYYNNKR
jgi:uncharacterized membrane protein YhaH (DUF805 family)